MVKSFKTPLFVVLGVLAGFLVLPICPRPGRGKGCRTSFLASSDRRPQRMVVLVQQPGAGVAGQKRPAGLLDLKLEAPAMSKSTDTTAQDLGNTAATRVTFVVDTIGGPLFGKAVSVLHHGDRVHLFPGRIIPRDSCRGARRSELLVLWAA